MPKRTYTEIDKLVRQVAKGLQEDLGACPEHDALIAYHSGELPEKQAEALREHLALCPGCVAELRQIINYLETVDEAADTAEHLDETQWERFIDSTGIPPAIPWWKKRLLLPGDILAKILENLWEGLQQLYIAVKNSISDTLNSVTLAFSKLVHLQSSGAYSAVLKIVIFIPVGFAAIYTISRLTEPEHYTLARLEETIPVFKGGDEEQALRDGITKFQEKQFPAAIASFDQYLENYPDHFHASYYKGLARLMNGEKSVLGLLFRDFSVDEVERGIQSLNDALKNTEGNQHYQQDCYWFLGKAYLMKGDVENARASFHNLLALSELGLYRKNDARKMLVELKRLNKR